MYSTPLAGYRAPQQPFSRVFVYSVIKFATVFASIHTHVTLGQGRYITVTLFDSPLYGTFHAHSLAVNSPSPPSSSLAVARLPILE